MPKYFAIAIDIYIAYYVSMIESRIQADGLLSPSGAPSFGLILDTNSFVPYYQQIVDHVRELVEKRALREGDGFFSEGEIARALGISKMPVRQAFQKLRAEGLLIVAKGKRPAIGSGRVPWNFQQLRGFSEEMRRRGLIPSARVLSMKVIEPELETAQALKLTLDEKVYALRRLRFVNAEPVAVVTSHLPVRIFTGIEKQDLEKQSLYQIFEDVYKRKLRWAEETIGATTAVEQDANVLQTKLGSPLLMIRETTYDVQNIPIEYSVSLLRGDRYTASVISVRKG